MLTKLKQSNYYLFELFLYLRLTALSASAIAISLLIQDKICLVSYGQLASFCQNIQAEMNTTEQRQMKDEILAATTQYGNYKNVLESIPMFIWSLFVGSFLDNFPGGTSILLLLNILGNSFMLIIYMINMYTYESSPYYMLIGSLSISFTGGMISLLTTAYRYITINTTEKNRNLKFVSLEIIYIIGISLAVYIGGQLLKPRIAASGHPQLRTYDHNFLFSLAMDILSLAVLYLLNKVDKNGGTPRTISQLEDEIVYSEIEDLLDNRSIGSASMNNNNYDAVSRGSLHSIKNRVAHLNTISQESRIYGNRRQNSGIRNFFRALFDLENARQTLHTFFKARPNRARLQIFLLYLILFSQVLTTQGISVVLLQFCEKVYSWDATMFSTVSAISQIISMTLLAVGSIFLVKRMRLDDGTLIVISQLSSFFRNILLGTFLNAFAYFMSIVIGSLSGFTVISARTKLSKIVATDEVGKIFSLSSTMDALIPIIGSLVYTNLFSISISTYPGLIYQFSAFVVVLSLVVIVFEEFYCPMKSLNESAEEERTNERTNGTL